MGWLTDRFIRGVTRRVSMPLNEVLIGASGILELADDMIAAHLVPKLISVREEFFVTSVDYPLATMVAAGGQALDIPYRAAGNSLRDLKLRTSATSVFQLSHIDLEEEHNFRIAGRTNAVFLKGDQAILVPPPSDGSWVVEIWHEQLPSKLTTIVGAVSGATGDNIDLAQAVSAINGDALTLAGSTVPSGIAVNGLVDVIKAKPGHRLRGIDLSVAGIAGQVVTLATGTTPSDTALGDFLAPAGYTPVIQLPDECCVFLETLVAKRCMSALGDYEARTALNEDEQSELSSMLQLLSPRLRGEPSKTVNRHGLLRGRRSFIRRGFYG